MKMVFIEWMKTVVEKIWPGDGFHRVYEDRYGEDLAWRWFS
ncbi:MULTISPECIES: hypothetical protein [Metabacillus]|nr:hypothetical protein [Metabacillus litoralis]